jgi:hypothetical protein
MLKRVPDNVENAMFFRHETEDGQWEVGLHPVMFGVRIRAGRVGYGCCLADICLGNNQWMASVIFSIVCAIIEERGHCPQMYEWPEFDCRPVWRDRGYMNRLINMLEDPNIIGKYDLPDIEEIRIRNNMAHGLV